MWGRHEGSIAKLEARVANALGYRSVRQFRRVVLRDYVMHEAEAIGLLETTNGRREADRSKSTEEVEPGSARSRKPNTEKI